ncbi:hypothetical protein DEH69_05855 [Streptomyces sp. PT12]|nr:hypothetical protein DEH69_05855 [Streptomyces sp. PT12]
MADVARSVGVSQKTVSRVVNGEPHVSPAVRQRVLREIERLGFLPNESARALVTRCSRRIGIVTARTSSFGPASVLRDLEHAARAAGYFVSVVHADEQDGGEVARAVGHLVSQGVDAIAVCAPLGPVDPAALVPAPLPSSCCAAPTRRGLPAATVNGAGSPSATTTSGARPRPPSTCSAWATAPFTTSRAPSPGPPPATGRAAGAPPCAPRARAGPRPRTATGAPSPATTPPANSSAAPARSRSPRSSRPTTRWPWAPSTPSSGRGGACRTTSASSASTTSRRPPIFPCPSPPSARTSPRRPGGPSGG